VHVDAAGTILHWNASAQRRTGIPAQDAIGHHIRTLLADGGASLFAIPPDDAPHALSVTLGSRGAALQIRVEAIALRTGDSADGWLVSLAPQRRYDEIEQLKNELVGSISHELKTPLATIKAYVETLRDQASLSESERGEYLDIVDQQADRLTRAIDDLLLVSRVEAGQLLKRRALLPLDAILDDALALLKLDPARHPIARTTAGIQVSGDPDLLRDAFVQVIDNAVKFSPEGGAIDVLAEQRGDACVVAIVDRGIGIAQDHLPYIFDRFYRVEHGLAARADGGGLGLFIASALVRAHGGAIAVRSEPGRGSTFTFSLPVHA
jgi:signal transduction histidine kinase